MMRISAYIAFIAAILCGVLRFATGKYMYSACISLLCGCTVALAGGSRTRMLLAAGLFVSVVADWFLAHQGGRPNFFLYGVAGFLVAHCLFGGYAAFRYSFGMPQLIVICALLAAYCLYLGIRVMPGVADGLKVPITAYMLVSIASLYLAVSMNASAFEKVLYAAGIASILFSDTMIAENIFVGVKPAAKLVHPTYYLCHWLIALSALIR